MNLDLQKLILSVTDIDGRINAREKNIFLLLAIPGKSVHYYFISSGTMRDYIRVGIWTELFPTRIFPTHPSSPLSMVKGCPFHCKLFFSLQTFILKWSPPIFALRSKESMPSKSQSISSSYRKIRLKRALHCNKKCQMEWHYTPEIP